MTLARRLKRTFVLPCVRGGVLVPCRANSIVLVPDGTNTSLLRRAESAILHAYDPLAVPAFREDCSQDSRQPAAEGRVYPLHAYLSPAAIRRMLATAGSVPAIDFETWMAREGRALPSRPHSVGVKIAGAPLLSLNDRGYCNSHPPAKFRGSLFFNTSLCIARDWRTGLDAINETVEAELPHGVRTARSLFFYDWYRSNRFDPLIGGLPEFNALHYAPVRTWLQTIARGSGGVGEHVPARPVTSAMPVSGGAHGQRGTSYAAGMVSALREGGGPFVVLQWRSELVKEGAFGACTAAMVNVTTRITDRLGNRSAFVDDKGGGNCGRSGLLAKLSDQSSPIPLILVTDLSSNWSLSASAAEAVARGATGGNASHQEHQYQPSCSVSRSYKNDMHSRRSMALDALLRIPGVLRYSVPASPETHVFVAGGPPLAVDVGVLAIREYILAVAADVYLTCWRRHPPQGASPPSALCSRCMWFSEFITRVGRHRAEAGIGQCTETDLWKSSAVSLL